MRQTVYLALGTNLGDRRINLRTAIEALSPDVRVLAESYIYETPPWGYTEQPAFLNMALKGETDLWPRALLTRVKQIEARLGRVPGFRYGPRPIDIDILLFDELVLDEGDLVIPHPNLHERAFVLVPLADVAADVIHPVLHRSIRELLSAVDANDIKPYQG